MEFSAAIIASLLGGSVEGDDQVKVNTLCKIQEGKPGGLAFLANPKYENYLYTSEASIVLINNNQELKQQVKATLIRVADAYLAFSQLLEFYFAAINNARKGIEQPSFQHHSAQIGNDCYLAAFSYLSDGVKLGNNVKIFPQVYIGEGVTIGDNSVIHSGAKIYAHCKIGNNVVVHSGAVVGSEGFGFAPQADGSYKAIPQIGVVILEDNVRVGANTTIDRATMGETVIKQGTKLDNLIQIAHNVVIGENTVIAAQAGIAGSTEIGANSMIGGQAGIAGHLRMAKGLKLQAQAGISKSITDENAILMGAPAIDLKNYMRAYAVFRNLPELEKRLAELERVKKESK